MDLINTEEIRIFLDTVNKVLNSNTFILKTKANYLDLDIAQKEIKAFLMSKDFREGLMTQSKEHGWTNYHYYDKKDGNKLKPNERCRFVKNQFNLTFEPIPKKKCGAYLRLMLMGDDPLGIFLSPYQKGVSKEEAVRVARTFLNCLLEKQQYRLFKLNTDFGYTHEELRGTKDICYFSGGMSSDAATLIVREDNTAFMILTNGTD
ncbi:MAG: hypothetical protein GY810_24970 [Aureispira sp.]|nr:hypothetical protein [Aureispira sp.]